MKKLFLAMIAGGMLSIVHGSSYANSLDHIQVDFLNDETNIVKLDFSDRYSKPQVIDNNNNELHLLFKDTNKEIKESFFNIQEYGIKNIRVEEVGSDVHVYISLVSNYNYDFSYLDKMMVLELSKNSVSYENIEKAWKFNDELKISNVEFVRHDKEHADIIVYHNDKEPTYEIVEFNGGVEFIFDEASIPSKLFSQNDVSEFSTPIESYITKIENGKVSVKVFFSKNYDTSFVTTKLDNKIVMIFNGEYYEKGVRNKIVIDEETGLPTVRQSDFKGEMISFDFQDVPIKNALIVLAKKMKMNLVIGENITGRITLLLDNVPHDQALEIILRTNGLGKYIDGSVMLIAPLEEIVQREEFELNSKKKITQISPLKSDTIQIKYAKASEIFTLLDTIKSERGKIIFDERTNKMFLEDIPSKLFEMKKLTEEIDIPVRQVSVEARIVYAKKSVNEAMGVKWGANTNSGGDWSDTFNVLGDSNVGIKDGSVLGSSAGNALNLTLGFMSSNVDATLSALEKTGDVEIVARPLVIAANKKKSVISSGKQYPYVEISDNGDVTTSFKDIVLSLDVTPQITPNDKLILDLEIIQDSIAELTDAGPALDSTKITTQVVISNNETLVLGGVFKNSEIKGINKVPILGDIPLLGKLFSYEDDTSEQVELLIFITPRILNDDEIIRK